MADKTTCWNCGIRYEYSRYSTAKCPDCGARNEDMPYLSGMEEEDERLQAQLQEIGSKLDEVESEYDETVTVAEEDDDEYEPEYGDDE